MISKKIERLRNELDMELKKGIEEGVAPTIGFSLINDGEIIYDFFQSDEHKKMEETYFDIASLTKTFITTVFLKKYEKKELDINNSVSEYIPEFRREDIKIKNLLLHNSGIPVDFYEKIYSLENKEKYTPEKDIVYSDANYILLGEILERDGGIIKNLQEEIFIPLEMQKTFYKPKDRQIAIENIVKTELRKDRGQVRGNVHDNKCFKMGEIGGQAGLFSTIDDLEKFVLGILNGKLLKVETISLFNDIIIEANETKRTLGWVRKDEKDQMGHHEKDFSLFHTGFTGGEILINFTKNIGIIMLTNRVSPTRDNSKIFSFRKKINNLII